MVPIPTRQVCKQALSAAHAQPSPSALQERSLTLATLDTSVSTVLTPPPLITELALMLALLVSIAQSVLRYRLFAQLVCSPSNPALSRLKSATIARLDTIVSMAPLSLSSAQKVPTVL